MKKTLVTTAMCMLGAASLMAQGRINFANSSATPIRINDGSITWSGVITENSQVTVGPTTSVLGTASTNVFRIGPASTRIQLYAGLTAASLAPVMIGTGANQTFVTNSASTSGTFQGTFPGGSNLALAGYDGSAPVFLRLLATSISSQYQYQGLSSIIQVNLATGVATATTIFAAAPNASQWGGITMYAVPEPSTFALAGLGAAAMLIFRRRK
jgi:hypothetical protein